MVDDIIRELRDALPAGVHPNPLPNTDEKLKISAYQRSHDVDRRDENHRRLSHIRRQILQGEDDLPVEITDVSDIETRYSEVYFKVTVDR